MERSRPPTKEEVQKAEWLAKKIVALQPGNFRRIWLTNWRKWRLLYETISLSQCGGNCSSCPVYKDLSNGVSSENPPVIKTDLHLWTDPVDIDLYGPIPQLACKSIRGIADGYVACMVRHPDYQDVDMLVDELELARDTRLIWSSTSENKVATQLMMQQAVVAGALAGSFDEQRRRIEEALRRTHWTGTSFATPREIQT